MITEFKISQLNIYSYHSSLCFTISSDIVSSVCTCISKQCMSLINNNAMVIQLVFAMQKKEVIEIVRNGFRRSINGHA